MPQWILNLNDFPRKNQFPFRVQQIYYCYNMLVPSIPRKWKTFEVCLRLDTDSDFTEDVVNDKNIKLHCPNVIWRLPGSQWSSLYPQVRDAISFSYDPEVVKKLETLGMNIENIAWNFTMTAELKNLIAKFWRTVNSLYTPGAVDNLDWICFCIMGTLRLQENIIEQSLSIEQRIRNISIWFQTHFSEKIDIDDVAASNNISHDHFYKMWKKFFNLSPSQYINNLRLEAAAHRLCESTISIKNIIQEVNFAGEYMFYKRFKEKYGITPHEYRKKFAFDNLSKIKH